MSPNGHNRQKAKWNFNSHSTSFPQHGAHSVVSWSYAAGRFVAGEETNFSKCCFLLLCSSSPLQPQSTASLPQSVLMAPSPFAPVETETHLTSQPSHPVTSRKLASMLHSTMYTHPFFRASPSVSAREVEALHQSISNRSQRGLAILAGSTAKPCKITKCSPFLSEQVQKNPPFCQMAKCSPFPFA